MTINIAQIVFNKETLTRIHIFSFLQVSVKQRIKTITQDKCPYNVRDKRGVIKVLKWLAKPNNRFFKIVSNNPKLNHFLKHNP